MGLGNVFSACLSQSDQERCSRDIAPGKGGRVVVGGGGGENISLKHMVCRLP